MSTPTALYRLFGDGDLLLYIGIAKTFGVRWHQHEQAKEWWPEVRRQTIEWHASREAAEDAERAAIKAERPKYNKQHNRPQPQPRHALAAPEGGAAVSENFRVLGVLVRDLRTANGMSQGALAARMRERGHPWHPTTVGRCEAGTRPTLIDELVDIEKLLGLPRGAFWSGVGPDEDLPARLAMLRGALLAGALPLAVEPSAA